MPASPAQPCTAPLAPRPAPLLDARAASAVLGGPAEAARRAALHRLPRPRSPAPEDPARAWHRR